jgi:hypothetical protein
MTLQEFTDQTTSNIMQKAIEHYKDLAARVIEGDEDALIAYGSISTTIKALQALEKVIKEKAIVVAKVYFKDYEKNFTHFGFAFEKTKKSLIVKPTKLQRK